MMSQEAALTSIKFWGKIYASNGLDYLVAVGYVLSVSHTLEVDRYPGCYSSEPFIASTEAYN